MIQKVPCGENGTCMYIHLPHTIMNTLALMVPKKLSIQSMIAQSKFLQLPTILRSMVTRNYEIAVESEK